jgi:DNA modification methylase
VWPISRPIPYTKNPRKIPAKAISKVAESIKAFGFKQPIVVDKQDVIIVGHTRLLGARKLGYEQVPVVVAADLTPAQVKAYRLADNRVSEESSWDDDLLGAELADLQELDFDLESLGFDDFELDRLLDCSDDIERAEETPPLPQTPVTQPGDVWILGAHRLVCGDSTNPDDVAKALNGVQPHLMVTDPPYGVNYDANWRNEADRANGKPYGASAVGKVENDGRADWSESYALFPGDVVYVWHPPGALQNVFYSSLVECGFDVRMQIIWAKSHFPIGRGNYHVQHEPCWYAVRKKSGATAHWSGDRKQSTLWQIDKPQKSETGHSTQKPIECMRRPILNNSSPGQAVYDPFVGSGTTLMAAELTGRVCHCLELSPAYCDVVVKRWEQYTGQKAVRITAET